MRSHHVIVQHAGTILCTHSSTPCTESVACANSKKAAAPATDLAAGLHGHWTSVYVFLSIKDHMCVGRIESPPPRENDSKTGAVLRTRFQRARSDVPLWAFTLCTLESGTQNGPRFGVVLVSAVGPPLDDTLRAVGWCTSFRATGLGIASLAFRGLVAIGALLHACLDCVLDGSSL